MINSKNMAIKRFEKIDWNVPEDEPEKINKLSEKELIKNESDKKRRELSLSILEVQERQSKKIEAAFLEWKRTSEAGNIAKELTVTLFRGQNELDNRLEKILGSNFPIVFPEHRSDLGSTEALFS